MPNNSTKCGGSNSGLILNPATRRCVKVGGRIGAKLVLASARALPVAMRALGGSNNKNKLWVSDERMRRMVQLVAPQHSMRPAARRLVQRVLWPVLSRLSKATPATWESTLREVLGPELAKYAAKEAERPGPPTFRLKGFTAARYRPVIRELTAAMEYLAVEAIERASVVAKSMAQWYYIGPETVLLGVSRDPELRRLLSS
jgi:hypothetical protein